MQSNICFIGSGNMARSLVGGLIKDQYDPQKIWVSDPHDSSLETLQSAWKVHTVEDNCEGARHADIILFAVKPQTMEEVVKEVSSVIHEKKPLVISIAAGVRIDAIAHWLGSTSSAIVRCMPNTPALVSCGATAMFANHKVTEEQKNHAESVMRAVGLTTWVDDEALLDTVTALSGSGPAYFLLMMEALVEAATELGLSEEQARLLTLQTALGTSKMALESEQSLTILRQQVTSPGGTTEAALDALKETKTFEAIKSALKAAQQKSEALAELFGKD